MRTIAASEFKAKCLSILDNVSRTGDTITVLKRGKPVAELGPVRAREKHLERSLSGSVTFMDDLMGPAFPIEDWEMNGPNWDRPWRDAAKKVKAEKKLDARRRARRRK